MIGELANHLWQSTLFLIVAGLLSLLLHRNRARIRYGVWLVASLKFLIPFAALVALGGGLVSIPVARSVVMRIPAPVVPLPVQGITEPFPRVDWAAPPTPAGVTAIERPAVWIPRMLFVAWLVGFFAVVGMRLRDWRVLRGAVRGSQPIDLRSKSVQISVKTRSSASLVEPAVIGVLNPVLLVPEDIADRLTPEQLEAVLAHEIRHVRRRDNLTAAMHMVVEALFWFYPPVWWIGTRLVLERERACDEEVLIAGHDPRVYAEAVLNVCRHFAASPMKCVSGIAGADIRRRLEMIAANVRSQRLGITRTAVLTLAALLALPGPVVFGLLRAGSLPELVSIAQGSTGPASLQSVTDLATPRGALERVVQLVGAELSNQITIEEHIVSADNTPFLGKGLEGVVAWRIEFDNVSLTGRLPVARPGEVDQYAGQRKVTVLIDRKTGQLLSVRSRLKGNSNLPPEPSWEVATSSSKQGGEVYEGFPNRDPKVTLLQAFNTEMSKGWESPFWAKEWDAFYVIHSGSQPSAQPVWSIVHKGVPPSGLEMKGPPRILTLTGAKPIAPPPGAPPGATYFVPQKAPLHEPNAGIARDRTYTHRVVLDAVSGEIIFGANQ